MRLVVFHLQFGRTLQNYQKAYRKKVEGLKTELLSTRGQVTSLEKRVDKLQGLAHVHLPSAAAGLLLGALAMRFAGRAARLILRRPAQPSTSVADSATPSNGNGNGHDDISAEAQPSAPATSTTPAPATPAALVSSAAPAVVAQLPAAPSPLSAQGDPSQAKTA